MITEILKCRICGNERLLPVLSLGDHYVIDFLREQQEGIKAPFELVLCSECHLLKLKHTVVRERLYRNEIKEEERAYLETGGKFIVPLPYPRLVTLDNEWPISSLSNLIP